MKQKMRLHVLYQAIENPWGGSNTFFRNFIREAQKDSSIEMTKKPEQADMVLTAGHYRGPGKFLKTLELRNIRSGRPLWHPWGLWNHKKKTKIVFRVDGLRKVYAEGTVPADEVLLRHLSYADGIIYQSRFSRQCFDAVSAARQKLVAVIPNGTNREVFFATPKPHDFSKGVRLISNGWSTNPRKGFKTIAAFSLLRNVTVQHIGRWPEGITSEKVELLGVKKENEIGDLLRRAHFFLFPSENEACPNVVVEALASGLPILYHPSGGTAELAAHNRFGMALPEDSQIPTLEEFMKNAAAHYTEMGKNIEAGQEVFDFSNCYRQYREMFEKVLRD
ncbi:MAG: glycosyltransferase [Candidatus Omnitrophica bacterium]|nr:glycosyltransferase [Candidatus Omnitrophota bacterium]